MTNLEIIKHLVGSNAKLSDERLSVAATLAGLVPSDEYVDANKCKIYGIAISEIQTDNGVKRFSEGDYSVEFRDSASSSILALARASGCPDLIAEFIPSTSQPVIKNASFRW